MRVSLVSQKEELLVVDLCSSSPPEAQSRIQIQKNMCFNSISSLPMRNIMEAQAEHRVVLRYKTNHLITLAAPECTSSNLLQRQDTKVRWKCPMNCTRSAEPPAWPCCHRAWFGYWTRTAPLDWTLLMKDSLYSQRLTWKTYG